ncbi:MAG TPA: RNA methyltransferase [Acidimicrobiia bacterium]
MESVRGHRNQRVVEAARLHRSRERRLTGRTLIEGPNLLQEALTAGVIPDTVFALPDDQATSRLSDHQGFELIQVDEGALARVAGTKTPRGPVAVIGIPDRASVHERGLLIAWGVSDPGNVGSLVRIAAVFGWDFGFTPETADPWSPKVLRAGSGGHFRIGIKSFDALAAIDSTGFTPVATLVAGGVAPASLHPDRYAVLIGEEASGLPVEVVESCPVRVTIPMAGGLDSLNAAMAAAIVVYELSKPEGQGERRV